MFRCLNYNFMKHNTSIRIDVFKLICLYLFHPITLYFKLLDIIRIKISIIVLKFPLNHCNILPLITNLLLSNDQRSIGDFIAAIKEIAFSNITQKIKYNCDWPKQRIFLNFTASIGSNNYHAIATQGAFATDYVHAITNLSLHFFN